MKKLLVTINASHSVDLTNVLQGATEGRDLPKGVQQIFDRIWLIDTHTCLPFFLSLVNNAASRGLPVAVLEVEDDGVLTNDLFPRPTQT